MANYFVKRLLLSILVIICVSMMAFGLVFLSGDPVLSVVSSNAGPQEIEAAIRRLGLDQPLYIQYWLFISRALSGDFGNSLLYRTSAMGLILERIPATAYLVAVAMGFSSFFGILIGVLMAIKPKSWFDRVAMFSSSLAQSAPVFWVGFLLIYFFSIRLKWLPPSGYGNILHVIMPAVTIFFWQTPNILRIARSSMLETLHKDFMRTAIAKGLTWYQVLFRHAFRNAIIPVVTVIGLQTGNMFGGAVIIETVFAWPGIGRLMLLAVKLRDFPLVQACVLIFATIFIILNLIADIIYVSIDPRIRFSKGEEG